MPQKIKYSCIILERESLNYKGFSEKTEISEDL
jgi:hypothetical protein